MVEPRYEWTCEECGVRSRRVVDGSPVQFVPRKWEGDHCGACVHEEKRRLGNVDANGKRRPEPTARSKPRSASPQLDKATQAIEADPLLSDREIAVAVGCSVPTAKKARRLLRESAQQSTVGSPT
jgi:copper chaperone CopZ